MDKMFPELKYYYVTCSEQVDSRQLSVLFNQHSPIPTEAACAVQEPGRGQCPGGGGAGAAGQGAG